MCPIVCGDLSRIDCLIFIHMVAWKNENQCEDQSAVYWKRAMRISASKKNYEKL